jgi:hypothetical protein
MKRTGLLLLFLLTAGGVFSLPVTVGNLNLIGENAWPGEDPTTRFMAELSRHDTSRILALTPLGCPVSGILEADRICREKGITLLLYGFITAGERWYDTEIKLYSAEEGKVIREFYLRSGLNEKEELLPCLAAKTVSLLYRDLGEILPSTTSPRPHNGSLSVMAGGGFWTCLGEWDSVLTGYGTLFSGLRFTCPTAGIRDPSRWRGTIRLGFSFTWSAGTNEPGYQPASLQEYRFRVPVDFGIDSGRGLLLFLSLAPLYQLVMIPGDDPRTAIGGSVAPGCEIALGAGQWLSFGCQMPFEATFFDKPQYVFMPVLYLTANIPFRKGTNGRSK